jgi:hypothetical protein
MQLATNPHFRSVPRPLVQKISASPQQRSIISSKGKSVVLSRVCRETFASKNGSVLVHDAEREVYVRACSRYSDDIPRRWHRAGACMRDEQGLDRRADGCGCLRTSMLELLGRMWHACACRKSMRLDGYLRGPACVSNMLCKGRKLQSEAACHILQGHCCLVLLRNQRV